MSRRSRSTVSSVISGDPLFGSNGFTPLPRISSTIPASLRSRAVFPAPKSRVQVARGEFLMPSLHRSLLPLSVVYSPARPARPRVIAPPSLIIRQGVRARSFEPLRSLSIRVPTRTRLCLQRRSRREVLFAYRKAGFSGSAPRRHYKRTQNSQYRC